MRDPAAEVDGELVEHGATAAVRIGGADEVVLGDHPTLGLVGVEQVGSGPAAQHPGQLPAEVVAALEGGVHPGAAAWRHAVGGVADEEGPARRGTGRPAGPASGTRRRVRCGIEVGDAGPDAGSLG